MWATSSATSTPAAARSAAPKSRGIAQVIDAMVPLANMFGYVELAALDVARGALSTP